MADEQRDQGGPIMLVQDEVCGMTIETEAAAASSGFREGTYYFCSERCWTRFRDHPDWYVPIQEETPVPTRVSRTLPSTTDPRGRGL